ncbi:MAG: primosomal protein N' [Bacteroidetes bacterium RIFCSPLOWO2_12_FULL_35_15]|nr:MAG: primosomal protein N' [Bacteroidetes bacterium RIFCSPLOWO2_12_FULL_35_15]
MNRTTFFVDVILPLAVPNLYTYRVPYDWNDSIAVGKRVIVQFGKGKLYSALVRVIHENPPKQYTAKYIDSILDEHPIVNQKQFELWDWMSQYYMCNIGDIMVAALPGGLRLASETKIILNPEYSKKIVEVNFKISDKEILIVDALEIRNVLTLNDISEIIEQKTVYPVIKLLIEKGIVLIQEELKEKFKPKIENYIRITKYADNEENLKTIFDALEKKAHKQLDVLMAYISLSKRYSKERKEVKKSEIIKMVEGAEAALRSLEKKNVFEIYEREVGRLASFENENKISELNEVQQKVYESIQEQFGWKKVDSSKVESLKLESLEMKSPVVSNDLTSNIQHPTPNIQKDVVLLHGVTSSGKTEIYVKLIEQTIAEGKQVLYLLPEIALTTQIINRLRKYFGEVVGVYHSKFNENERVEIWNNILSSKTEVQSLKLEGSENSTTLDSKLASFKLIIGARSALFLPYSNLGLVIVDEEHDTSYKQYDPSPRYNARDGAIYLAHIHKAKTLLGSATPSLESYYNAQEGKYGFTEINQRFGGIQMPEILIADVKEATRKKQMKSHFTPLLLDTVTLALGKKEQVILFQNRRGFAPQLECNMCAWVPQCTNCDVSLTYHKATNQLRCHYCGYSIKPPSKCAACGDTDLRMKGFGTEKIEEELQIFYPKAKIARMDLDTTRSKFAHQHIIQDFEEGNIDILVGTQMVTKGLDFDNVSMVGVLNADSMLNFPDFRSFERSYQLMAQVSGRAGRKNKRGTVIIQTQNPEHSIIQEVIANDYLSMYTNQLLDRKNFNYPPFFRLIEITVIHRDVNMVNASAKYLADELKRHFKKRVLGPEFPLVSRIRNLYHKNILLKIERDASVVQVKKIVTELLVKFKSGSDHKAVRVQLDVDPM